MAKPSRGIVKAIADRANGIPPAAVTASSKMMGTLDGYLNNMAAAATSGGATLAQLVANLTTLTNTNKKLFNKRINL